MVREKIDVELFRSCLGITKSYSRSKVGNDHAHSEALFKVLKYTKDFPQKGFASIEKAREWIQKFVTLHNTKFLHSSIKFIPPHQMQYGLAQELLKNKGRSIKRPKKQNQRNSRRGSIMGAIWTISH